MDKIDRKRLFWDFSQYGCAMLVFLLTDNYYALLVGMFLAMGASTLLNTSITLITPFIFATSPAMIVNVLFFTQGIGTSGGQSLIGNLANDFGGWKVVTGCAFCHRRSGVPDHFKTADPGQRRSEEGRKGSAGKENEGKLPLDCHGGDLWCILYCRTWNAELVCDLRNQCAGTGAGKGCQLYGVVFGGMTVGRLVFSPLVDRLKVFPSIALFSVISAVLYAAGIFSGALWMLSLAGLFCSIIYPTLVMAIGRLYDPSQVSTMSGLIISVASLFDIGFNYIYGDIAEKTGYGRSFLIMPAAMILFTLLFVLVFHKRIPEQGTGIVKSCIGRMSE